MIKKITAIIFLCLQVCSNNQITLEFKFQPTSFSNKGIDITRDFVGDEPTILNISSPDIKFNEYYEVAVRVNGTTLSNLHFSEFNYRLS